MTAFPDLVRARAKEMLVGTLKVQDWISLRKAVKSALLLMSLLPLFVPLHTKADEVNQVLGLVPLVEMVPPPNPSLVIEVTTSWEIEEQAKATKAADEAREASRRKILASKQPYVALAISNLPSELRCSCVLYVKFLTGQMNGVSVGTGGNWPINSKVPAATGIVVTREGNVGHVAYYVRMGDILILQESNFTRCTVTAGRVLKTDSPVIKGYWNW